MKFAPKKVQINSLVLKAREKKIYMYHIYRKVNQIFEKNPYPLAALKMTFLVFNIFSNVEKKKKLSLQFFVVKFKN